MRRVLMTAALGAAITLLAACGATAPKTQVIEPIGVAAESDQVGSFAAGTLAPLGSFEWRVAPTYTRNATARHDAARALRKRELSFEQGAAVLTATDRARTALDAAVKADASKNSKLAEQKAKEAADAVAEAQTILGGVQ